MKPYRIFVSSAQKELKEERKEIQKYIRQNPLLNKYFEVFLFEDAPARGKTAEQKYISEVDKSDIYLGILGKEYGKQGTDGLSPVEREFRRATEKGKERLIYIKGRSDAGRDERMKDFIKRISLELIRRRYKSVSDLMTNITESLVDFLEDQGRITALPFDALICPDASYEDINENLVKDFLAKRAKKRRVDIPKISVKDFLCRTIKVVKKKDAVLKPTNAALLFFCDHPQGFIPQSSIKLARFRGNTRVEFLDSQELPGNIYKVLDDTEKFIKRNTRLASKIVEFKRVDIPEYPYEAIREAVINAIAHRDYFRMGSNVQIDIFYGRIEVTNPGKLLPGLDINNLEGVHETRNREICKIFHETKDMEKYGTGIAKMNLLMKKHGLAPPVLSQPGNFFRVTFNGPGEKILDLVPSIPEERQTDLRESGLNERQIEVLRLMVNEGKTLTIKEDYKIFDVNEKTLRRDLKKLVSLGFVEKVGSTKKAYFKARERYGLPEK